MKKIETKNPIFKNVQVDEMIVTKWVTEDGKVFNDERSAESWEFYYCKVKKREGNVGFDHAEIFDFTCKEDLDRYNYEYGYGIDSYDYNKDNLVFPGTYVLFNRYEDDEDSEESEWGHKEQITIGCLMKIDEYKEMMINKIEELK